jgi:tRNA(Ile)-lysidine synthase
VARGARLAVGVSGGADSLALLVACAVLAGRGVIAPPLAVHVHHHLRRSADGDARHVAAVAERLGVELKSVHVFPQRSTGGVAAAARRMRYVALEQTARERGIGHVAVAHHARDQLETMLMALGRGAGLDGLAAMPWSRPLGEGIAVIRPLLDAPKEACESLCRAARLTWREDPTNRDARSVRIRLRRDVIPVLESLWPGAAVRAAGAAEILDAASGIVMAHIAQVLGEPGARRWDRARLAALAAPLIAMGLRHAAVTAVPDCADRLGRSQLRSAAAAIASCSRRPRSFDWPGGLQLIINARHVELRRPSNRPKRVS